MTQEQFVKAHNVTPAKKAKGGKVPAWVRREMAAQRLASYTQAEIAAECHFCGRIDKNEMTLDDSRIGIALGLLDIGWREVRSRKYQVIAAACPDCAKKDDDAR